MRFIEDGPSIPDELLNARDEGRVVFFCGSGVSRARAELPNFFGLADAVLRDLRVSEDSDARWLLEKASALGEERNVPGLISADRVFGLLERQFLPADVYAAVARALEPSKTVDLSAHRLLLRLAKTPDSKTQLVTTNFDTLFDACEEGVASHQPPRLPDLSGHDDLDGIVYLHGRVDENYTGADSTEFILSSSGFGHAYLSEGWATQFCREIIKRFVVVFVGYSADDPPIHYLLEGLSRSNDSSRRIYAFQAGESEEIAAIWGHKNVEAIPYAEAEGHRALWKTLEEWGQRADDPARWRQSVIELATDGPEALSPHERGQVAHIVSTVEGAQEFAKSRPPAEWLCVFDPSCRYARQARTRWFDTEEPDIDPFLLFGLDSDVTPERLDPENKYARHDVPSDAWDAFLADQLDRQNASDDRIAAFRGHFASHFPQLPKRLEYLAGWLMEVVDQPALAWWAVRQRPLHPDVQSRIQRQLELRPDDIDPDLLKTWHYLLEAWERPIGESGRNWFELKREIDRGGWNSASIRQFLTIMRPTLKASPGHMSGPKPPESGADFRMRDLVQLEVECPDLPDENAIPDDWLEPVIRGLRQNLELAVQLSEEVDDLGRHHICPIIPDSSPDISKYQRTHGLSGYVIRFASLFERLAKLNVSLAQREVLAWPMDDDTAFCRLRIWTGGRSEITTPQAFCQILMDLSDNAFWSSYHQRDLLLALAVRWKDLPQEASKRIEKRLLDGPARWEGEDEAEHEERRAWHTLQRLQWLADRECRFSFDLKKEISMRSRVASDWKPESANHAADSREIRGGHVATNTEHENLLHGPIDTVLARALEASGRVEGNRLEERDSFAGLCEEDQVRAFQALENAAQRNEYPKWAWTTFLGRRSTEEDGPALLAQVAQSICAFPNDKLVAVFHSVTAWLKHVSKRLSEHSPEVFGEIVSKFVEALHSEPSQGNSIVLNTGKTRDWVTQATNSPAGNVAWALLDDSRLMPSQGKTHFSTQWLDQSARLLALSGDPRRYAITTMAVHLDWLYHHIPVWTEDNVLSALEGDDDGDREALWGGFLWHARVGSIPLYQRLKPGLLSIVSKGTSSRERHVQSLAYLLLQGWISIDGGERAQQVSNSELREALLAGGGDFRSHVLWQLGKMLRDEKGPSKEENALSVEFFQDVWPRQKTVKTPETTVGLCEVLMRSGESFPDLAEVVLPHLTGLSHHGNSLHFTDEVDSAINSAPKLFLEMLYSVLPNDVTGWPYGIGEVLAKLVTADSDLGTEQHFVELKRIWDAR